YRPNVLPLTRARPVRSGNATRSVAMSEPRKRRASERPRIGCCGELGGGAAGAVSHILNLTTIGERLHALISTLTASRCSLLLLLRYSDSLKSTQRSTSARRETDQIGK